MAAKDVAALLAREFVTVKLDFDRGIGAKDIERNYIEKEQALPWFAFLNGDGKCLIHSTRSNGRNIGLPFQSDAMAYFETMLRAVKNHLTDEDIDFLIRSLEAFNSKAGLRKQTNL